jgi:hypothetical protein
MKPNPCEREGEVLAATRTGRWPELLVAHRRACPSCQEAALVASFLTEQAEPGPAEAPLASPGLIWWKAELLGRRQAVERATKPIANCERAAAVCLGAGGVGAVLWKRALLQGWLEPLGQALSQLSAAEGLPALAVGGGSVLFVFVLVFALYAVWADV